MHLDSLTLITDITMTYNKTNMQTQEQNKDLVNQKLPFNINKMKRNPYKLYIPRKHNENQ